MAKMFSVIFKIGDIFHKMEAELVKAEPTMISVLPLPHLFKLFRGFIRLSWESQIPSFSYATSCCISEVHVYVPAE